MDTIDVHFLRMEEWLRDRAAVLQPKAPREYAFLMESAPKLVQLVTFDLPALRRKLSKAESVFPEVERQLANHNARAAKLQQDRATRLARFRVDPSTPDGAIADLLAARSREAESRLAAEVEQSAKSLLFERIRDYFAKATGNNSLEAFTPTWAAVREIGLAAPSNAASDNVNSSETEDDVGIDWGEDLLGEIVDCTAPPPLENGQPCGNVLWDFPSPALSVSSEDFRAVLVEELETMAAFFTARLGAPSSAPPSCGVSIPCRSSTSSEGDTTLRHAIAAELRLTDVSLHAFQSELNALVAVRGLVQRLTVSDDATLVALTSSARLLRDFLRDIEALSQFAERATSLDGTSEDRLAQASAMVDECATAIAATTTAVRELRDACEAALSKMFAPRAAFLVGEINKI